MVAACGTGLRVLIDGVVLTALVQSAVSFRNQEMMPTETSFVAAAIRLSICLDSAEGQGNRTLIA